METAKPENRPLSGRVIGDLAREAGKDPFDWFLDYCLDGEMGSLVDCKMFNVDEDRVRDLLNHPHGVVGLSDAGAHLSFLCDAGFGLHLFGHWVRDRKDISLERAVAAVTSRVADVYRIKERGRLKWGRAPTCCSSTPRRWGAASGSGGGICRPARTASIPADRGGRGLESTAAGW